jgi:chromosomal replication initiation ATPase DnaA
MQQLTQTMTQALGAMDLVKINESMTNFEKMFDNIDVNAQFMDRVMDNVNAGAYEENDVNNLIGQVAQEFNIKLEDQFSDLTVKDKIPEIAREEREKQKMAQQLK